MGSSYAFDIDSGITERSGKDESRQSSSNFLFHNFELENYARGRPDQAVPLVSNHPFHAECFSSSLGPQSHPPNRNRNYSYTIYVNVSSSDRGL